MNTIHNPNVPFNIPIPGGVQIGRLIKVQGSVPYSSNRFSINLICGPMGDVALQICPNFGEKCVVRNSIQRMQMGYEERSGPLPIHPGQNFELLILCDPQNFKIAFNGQHFTEFNHRLPFGSITNLSVDGQVSIYLVNFDHNVYSNQNIGLVAPPNPSWFPPTAGQVVPPYPTQPLGPPRPPYLGNDSNNNSNSYNSAPYPQNNPIYPQQQGYGSSVPYSQPHINPGAYSHPQGHPHYPHSPKAHGRTGLLDKVGLAAAGALGTGALLGGKKAIKKQMKAQKKALKYGLPLAGAGIGAYALHKGLRGFRRSSSSSSSSSD